MQSIIIPSDPTINEPLVSPLSRPPAAHENDAAYILVEGETNPHADETVTQWDADDITQAYGDAPVEDNGDNDRVDGVARSEVSVINSNCDHSDDGSSSIVNIPDSRQRAQPHAGL